MQPRTAIALIISLLATTAGAQTRVSPELQRAVRNAGAGPVAAWVYFAGGKPGELDAAERALTAHARARRLRNRGAGRLVDAYDLPVPNDRIDAVRSTGAHVRHVSRWLNAVSVDATPEVVAHLEASPLVQRLDVVRVTRAPLPQPSPAADHPPRARIPAGLNYGASAAQIQMMGVHTLHDLGLSGSGVWIAMFDTGLNNPGHVVFQSTDIMVTRDFVNGDSLITDDAMQMGNGNHGTMTLSVIGGYSPGNLIGPAYGARYILAKTENTLWERHVEEDAWVAAAEWADSIGADIISSSLGYSTGFTNGEASYTWQDMDGATTIVTIGADIAASRGILVVNSAGNDGAVALPANTLIGPADGDSVLCVGAVDASGVRASFSSVGPTADGRTKPDVMGMGLGVTVASPFDQTSFTTSSGTSFSAPLVAGAAALLLEARPGATNQAIMAALRATASQPGTPDRFMGWGIVNAPAALARIPTAIAPPTATTRAARLDARPNPFNPSTLIEFEIPAAARVSLVVYDAAGRRVDTLLDGEYRPAGRHSVRYQSQRASGVYFVRMTAGAESVTRKIVLLK